ncbi:hypothetical protein BD324DRAFT_58200 [Kockovaella imperatae]|uniref:Uncharacterized protein n=1 Tax=Kockovaella imperatae TaxID=4999 RepID=A0A1Y1UBW8_9TREE|nr:hypothetical protein BD324DRAFT_58200 [Kockovaella imperatae]ORX35533.1 hypothetical protein BD324DRAFT_58200 [Kockovaella imperatae]
MKPRKWARLRPLFVKRSEHVLEFYPRDLDGLTISVLLSYLLICSLYNRITRLLPTRLRKRSISRSNVSVSVPFRLVQADIDKYATHAGLADSCSRLEPSSTGQNLGHAILREPLHVHALLWTVCTPTLVLLLVSRLCPVDPIGNVNVRNRFEVFDMARCVADLTWALKGNDLSLRATLSPEWRTVRRGWEYDITVEVYGRDYHLLSRQIYTMLQFANHGKELDSAQRDHKRGNYPASSKTEEWPSPLVEATPSLTFRISSDEPLRWAQLCKDYNPIHISKLGARLLGFRYKVVHASLLSARAISLVDKVDVCQILDVEMRRPTFVSKNLHVQEESGRDQIVLKICESDKVNMVITIQRKPI